MLSLQWLHNYAALGGNLTLTALVVAIPIFYLFWALSVKRMKGHIAGMSTLLLTLVITVAVYGMPITAAVSASVLGIVNGLFPIGWIILMALFLYNLTVESGQFEIIKSSISSLTTDRRLQALLIAFGFSGFLEACSGQGAPVAVSAAMLIGLGFPALPAAVICMVANTPPVPFGPIGTPTIMMATVTELSPGVVAQAIGLDMSILAFVIPVFMLVVLAGWKHVRDVLPAALVTSASYSAVNYLVSQYMGPELPGFLASFACMLSLGLFLKVWKPDTIWRFPNDPVVIAGTKSGYSMGQTLKAWSPFILVMIVMAIWGMPKFKNFIINDLKWFINIPVWPGLDGVVFRSAPIVATASKYAASYRWDYFTAPGTAMMIAALFTTFILGISPARAGKVFAATLKQLQYSLITLGSLIGLAFLSNYSGMSYTLGLAFATTGALFPIFSPVIGWLGVFLTGSVTSSAALFGKLQQVTALQLGLNPMLTISGNLFGGVIGKLISPQSLAIACAATGLVGRETDVFRITLRYSLYLLCFVIVIILMQAYMFPGMLPKL